MIKEALKVLIKYWGHSSFRPMQEDIIASILDGNDTLALLPTGGGKSITFQVPAIILDGICIVISPLIALMKDQVQNLKKQGIKAGAIYSGMSKDEIESVYNNCIHEKFKFLYVSPERLENEAFRHLIGILKVNILCIDEAHCISQWGYDFRPPYLKIAEIRNLIPKVPVLALTATATPDVVNDIMDKLNFKNHNVIKAGFLRKNISYSVFKETDKTAKLLEVLKKTTGSSIVYVRNRRRCRELSEIISKNGITSNYYHAGLNSRERVVRQEEWTLNHVKNIVATNAFGMGIDKPDVRLVVHYDLPDSIESYFQEAGRAGRDGKTAGGLLLYNIEDIHNSINRLKSSYPDISFIKKVYNGLGNFFQIPEGSGKDIAYNFNISEFCSNYNLKIFETYSAIKILEREGFIYYIESSGQFSKIMFVLNKEDLYRFQVENQGSERIIKEMLRSYSGIFTEFVNINENLIASRTEMTREQVVNKLTYLHNLKVIKYIPVRISPQIVLTSNRLGLKNIEFTQENYINIKKSSEKRLQSLLDFLSNSMQCRSQQLLSYFGETKSQRCGICDVCRKKSEVKLNDIEFEAISAFIKEELQQEKLHLYELVARCSKFNENQVLAAIQWLIDNKKIIRSKDEKLNWHDQLDISFL
ncbi:MAG: RecQ family ATP-dependent DNA helicase [Marinilabiliales bacterium]|nr:MAG: RecQ family ATP-dependent DNA helicase [Marinilabiliales bacterium]